MVSRIYDLASQEVAVSTVDTLPPRFDEDDIETRTDELACERDSGGSGPDDRNVAPEVIVERKSGRVDYHGSGMGRSPNWVSPIAAA
jgi:hypothetical protein